MKLILMSVFTLLFATGCISDKYINMAEGAAPIVNSILTSQDVPVEVNANVQADPDKDGAALCLIQSNENGDIKYGVQVTTFKPQAKPGGLNASVEKVKALELELHTITLQDIQDTIESKASDDNLTVVKKHPPIMLGVVIPRPPEGLSEMGPEEQRAALSEYVLELLEAIDKANVRLQNILNYSRENTF